MEYTFTTIKGKRYFTILTARLQIILKHSYKNMTSLLKTAKIRTYKVTSQEGEKINLESETIEIEFSEFVIDEGLKGVRTEDGIEYLFSDKFFEDNELIEITIKKDEDRKTA